MTEAPTLPSQILVLGATGLIGHAAVQALLKRGHRVRGLARGASNTTRSLARVDWRFADMAGLQTAADWTPVIAGCAAVVNLAGALQDGARDQLDAIHGTALAALAAACPPGTWLVQISTPGASADASTDFYRSKAVGDAAVRSSPCNWVILRPTVVVGREAYGGSALLRALAAFPGLIPVVHGEAVLQTVALEDVAAAICMAAEGRLPAGSDVVLAEPESRNLTDVLRVFRSWLGLPPAPVFSMPRWTARLVSWCADAAGYVGWRSPLRSTAITVSSEGVTGDGSHLTRLTGLSCRPLEETLALMPATVQERWFARLYLVKPLIVLMLALFWLLSGAIGLARVDAAAATLLSAGFAIGFSKAAVIIGAIADLAVGALVIHRRTMVPALLGMCAITGFYLAAATVFVPHLWLDPLGPLLKAVPVLMLALVALAIGPER